MVCWGDDTLDQLGRAEPGPGPAPVEGLTSGVAQVSAGGIHTCALLEDGSVVCWGDGSEGQLGQGSDEDEPRAVAVHGLTGPAAEISAGGYHTCARMKDGGIECWGENRYGQLGDGTRTARTSAVPVQGLAGPARLLAVGSSFSCALLTSGAVQCWGSNEMGERGLGMTSQPPRPNDPLVPPTTVKGLESDVVTLRADGNHACAELADSSIFCWGANDVGQLGNGRVTPGDLPVAWEGRRATLPRPAVAALGAGPLEGFDVSYHSGRVDFAAAKEHGHLFGLTMATAGVDFIDPFFHCH